MVGIVIYSNDPETVWNALRFGNFALDKGDDVKVFFDRERSASHSTQISSRLQNS